MENESYIDWMVRSIRSRFDRSKLKPILDMLCLKKGEYCISGDLGYQCIKLIRHNAEIREYDDGKIFVHFGYNESVGAWGGYTRRCEVKDTNIFKDPMWFYTIKQNGTKTSSDVIMI